MDFGMNRHQKFIRGFTAYDRNIDTDVGRAALE
jgi:hypothetical protein